jgi:hypothetical protein
MNETNKKLILNPEVYLPTITFVFLNTFGLDALSWEPETIKYELELAVGQTVPERNLDKINVGTTVIYTNAAEIYPDLFEKVCMTAHNDYPDTDVWQPLTPEQLMQGLVDFQILTSRDFKPWSDVEAYIKAVLFDNGYSHVPPSIAALSSITDTTIPHGVSEDAEHQKHKDDAAQEYITEILRVRMLQLETIVKNEQPKEDTVTGGDGGKTTDNNSPTTADN